MENRPGMLGDFREGFVSRIEDYIRARAMKRFEFGNLIGWSSGAVSAALNQPRTKCSEKFVFDVSRTIPEFAHEFLEYRRIEEEELGLGPQARTVETDTRMREIRRRLLDLAREAKELADDLGKTQD